MFRLHLKKIWLFFFIFLISTLSFAQNNDGCWEHPALQALEVKDSAYAGFGLRYEHYVPTVALDKRSGVLYFFTRYGSLYDSLCVDEVAVAGLLQGKLASYDLYRAHLLEELERLDKQRSALRQKRPDSFFQLHRMIPLEEERCAVLCRLFELSQRLNFPSLPNEVVTPHGSSKQYKDSTVWYNPNELVRVYKAVLDKKTKWLRWVTRSGRVQDSMRMNAQQLVYLQAGKLEPFVLLRFRLEARRYAMVAEGRRLHRLVKQVRSDATIQKKAAIFDEQLAELGNALYALTVADSVVMRERFYRRLEALENVYEVRSWHNLVGFIRKGRVLAGLRRYELTNHLGNVQVVVSDKKYGRGVQLSDSVVDHYVADVVRVEDYYPFGMGMPGRAMNADTSGYRYGFNGKEDDGETGTQDYGMRIYKPELGRFLSVDPLYKSYPWYTPYQFAGNKPVWATDIDGLEENTLSTYVRNKFPIPIKPTFQGLISVTDATTQSVHKTFEGNYAQLKKADATGLGPAIVNQLTSFDAGNSASKLDIIMTSTRSEVSKSWKGTDIKYFTQYAYSLVSNNFTEQGTFELQTAQAQVSARVWDPATLLLLNKVVSSIVINAARIGGTAATEEMVTLYRSISKAEMESIQKTRQLSFAEGQMEVKQFWQTTEGLEAWNKSRLAGEYNLEITVPKSLLGKGKPLNTTTQVDEFYGPTATIDNAAQLNTVNQSIRSIKITPVKTP